MEVINLKREFLKELGLPDDQIDKIMAENGKDIEVAKGDLKTKDAEISTTKQQLVEANKTIESYKSMDIDAIKKDAADYKIKFEDSERKAQEQIDSIKFDHAIENALNKAGAKNAKAAKALLDIEKLKSSKNLDSDITADITALKESDAYLFPDNEPGGTGGSMGNGGRGGNPPVNNPWSKETFNLTEQGKLLTEQPELAKQYQASAKK